MERIRSPDPVNGGGEGGQEAKKMPQSACFGDNLTLNLTAHGPLQPACEQVSSGEMGLNRQKTAMEQRNSLQIHALYLTGANK